MNSGMKIVGLVAALGIVIAASIWLGRQNRTKLEDPDYTRPPVAISSPPSLPISNAPVVTHAATSSPVIIPATNLESPIVANAGSDLLLDWNEKLDEALKSGGEDRDVAKSLLKMFPRLPPDGQEEVVQHISNLLPDEDYPELAKLMEDAKLPEEVLDQLIMDLLNRPNKIMLPELVQVAKNSQHPKAGEAKDFLELYLEEDYGADWNLWQTKVDEWLKANPE